MKKFHFCYRFYVNFNQVINDFTGMSGPTKVQKAKLATVREEIALLEAKINANKFHTSVELKNLRLKERILELQILRVYTVICRNHMKQIKNL